MGCGFRREAFDRPVASLSGGEQNRLMLAKLLLAEPNVMVLDEPSNHLDIEATEWLEEFLLESSAAMIVVSHDRYFLDKVTNRTLELFHGTVDSYAGNFSAYWQQKAERLLVERRTYEKQQRRSRRPRTSSAATPTARSTPRPRTAARSWSGSSRSPRRAKSPRRRCGFPAAGRSGDIVRPRRGPGQGLRPAAVYRRDLDIIRGQRWALLGPNGCGKTTLVALPVGPSQPDEGEVRLGQGVTVGYFDQQLAGLDDEAPVVDAIRPAAQAFQRAAAARLAGPLRPDRRHGRCKRSAASAAASDAARPWPGWPPPEANFLVLDEPTNHLDLWARDALEKAIAGFDGTVLLVSHDRYFVNRVADHLLVIEPGADSRGRGELRRIPADVPPGRRRRRGACRCR